MPGKRTSVLTAPSPSSLPPAASCFLDQDAPHENQPMASRTANSNLSSKLPFSPFRHFVKSYTKATNRHTVIYLSKVEGSKVCTFVAIGIYFMILWVPLDQSFTIFRLGFFICKAGTIKHFYGNSEHSRIQSILHRVTSMLSILSIQ